ncbi:MAG: type II secretion system protein GspL [Nitrospirota bacterium]|nr:type II secretion system protein GspL [Nitrospirota bacterium]
MIGIHAAAADGGLAHVARMGVGMKGNVLQTLGTELQPHGGEPVAVLARTAALREVTVPFTDVRKAAQVAPYEVEGHVPFDMDEVVTSLVRLDGGPDSTRLLVGVAPEEHIADIVGQFGESARQVQTIVPEPYALFCFARALAGEEGPVLFVDVRRERVLLLAMEGRRWIGSRTVSCQWDESAETGFPAHVSAALRRAAQSLYGGKRVAAGMVVTGEGNGPDGSPTPETQTSLAESMGLPLLEMESAPGFQELSAGHTPGQLSAAAIAIGLSLAGASRGSELNLRAGAFALGTRGEVAVMRRVVGIGAALLGLLLVVWVDGLAREHATRVQLDTVNTAMELAYRETFPGVTRVVDPVAQARTAVLQMRARCLLSGCGGTSALGFLSAVSRAIPEDLTIDVREFSVDGEKLRMEAEVLSFDAIDQVREHIEAAPEFSDVKISDATATPKDNKVKFRVSALLAEGT